MGPVWDQPGRVMTNGPVATAPAAAIPLRNCLRSMVALMDDSFRSDLEVLLAHRVALLQLAHAALEDDLSLRHHVDALGEGERGLHGLLDGVDGRPARVDGVEDAF